MSERLLKRKNSGSVFSLRPDQPINCFTNCTILEVSRLMTENRVNCINIVDLESNKLRGLVTAKDLAFRVVAVEMKNVDTQTIDTIMTESPLVSSVDTSANEALRLMVEKRVRHLPLIDHTGVVKGMLNITKCFYHAMIRLEKMSIEAEKLQNTFEDLQNVDTNYKNSRKNSYGLVTKDDNGEYVEQSTIINNSNSQVIDTVDPLYSDHENVNLIEFNILAKKKKIVDDLSRLIELMTQPNLKVMLRDSDLFINKPVFISSRTSVSEAAKLLKSNNLTAVLICDDVEHNSDDYSKDRIIGILTTKDIAFRVLALNIDPKTTSIARVMTPKPNFADDNMTIHKALRMMYEGKFLNLPVIDSETKEVTGLVSVLQLTYSLLRILDRSSSFSDNNSNTAINSNPEAVFEDDNFSVTSINDGGKNFKEGPAWNQFWGSLDRPLSTVESNEKLNLSSRALSFTRSSVSSIEGTNLTPQKRFSYSNKGISTNNVHFNDETTAEESYGKAVRSPSTSTSHISLNANANINNVIPSASLSSEVENIYSYDKLLTTTTGTSSVQRSQSITLQESVYFKIKIQSNLLEYNNRIYKLKVKVATSQNMKGVFEKVKQQVLKKMSPLNSCLVDLKIDLCYIDEENDLVTLNSDEDLENALELQNSPNLPRKKNLLIIMKVNKEITNVSKNFSFKSKSKLMDIPQNTQDLNESDYLDNTSRYLNVINTALLASSVALLGIYFFQKSLKKH